MGRMVGWSLPLSNPTGKKRMTTIGGETSEPPEYNVEEEEMAGDRHLQLYGNLNAKAVDFAEALVDAMPTQGAVLHAVILHLRENPRTDMVLKKCRSCLLPYQRDILRRDPAVFQHIGPLLGNGFDIEALLEVLDDDGREALWDHLRSITSMAVAIHNVEKMKRMTLDVPEDGGTDVLRQLLTDMVCVDPDTMPPETPEVRQAARAQMEMRECVLGFLDNTVELREVVQKMTDVFQTTSRAMQLQGVFPEHANTMQRCLDDLASIQDDGGSPQTDARMLSCISQLQQMVQGTTLPGLSDTLKLPTDLLQAIFPPREDGAGTGVVVRSSEVRRLAGAGEDGENDVSLRPEEPPLAHEPGPSIAPPD